ncbi:hypothetical protein [Patiriisocius sp. Uisw_017]|uniref:hypothetical protein n=1 Tax=Patiriisocius sp. Uisw_017 TaxID=3230968 RepID=UPI0039EAC668
MKNLFALSLLLSLYFSSHAKGNYSIANYPNEKASFLTFNLLTTFILDTTRYRMGYIHPINKQLCVLLGVGFGSEVTNFIVTQQDRDDRDNHSFFEVRPQIYSIL